MPAMKNNLTITTLSKTLKKTKMCSINVPN